MVANKPAKILLDSGFEECFGIMSYLGRRLIQTRKRGTPKAPQKKEGELFNRALASFRPPRLVPLKNTTNRVEM
jgi:hypothetical protein